MNNLTFGNDRVQYYETVASGSGAGDGFDGADAVQTHMTNSRLTDPESAGMALPRPRRQLRHPRRTAAAPGRWHGGCGVERRMRFLEPMTIALLTSHRRVAAVRHGGRRARSLDGRQRPWNGRTGYGGTPRGCDTAEVGVDDVLVLRTPGGGGYGRP